LDIGADSPAEIAVSTIAEILAVLRQRTAKHLRLERE
jgi:xanthine/CO dehydrogenase XdhC/CoxF family maturation factor